LALERKLKSIFKDVKSDFWMDENLSQEQHQKIESFTRGSWSHLSCLSVYKMRNWVKETRDTWEGNGKVRVEMDPVPPGFSSS
jgi:hypothetical protein